MERVKSLSAVLRALCVDEFVTLPIEQLASFSTTYYRTLAPERAKGMRLSVRQDLSAGTITVTRTA